MAKTNLKPCPFCGGKAERHESGCIGGGMSMGDWFVQCMTCFAATELQESQGAATRAWNKRTKEKA